MTFNQTVWDALCYAARHGYPDGLDALAMYAQSCDGKLVGEYPLGRLDKAILEFVPNPIPKY